MQESSQAHPRWRSSFNKAGKQRCHICHSAEGNFAGTSAVFPSVINWTPRLRYASVPFNGNEEDWGISLVWRLQADLLRIENLDVSFSVFGDRLAS
jgi:hypothetical protein